MDICVIPNPRTSLRRQGKTLSALKRTLKQSGMRASRLLVRGARAIVSTPQGPVFAVAQPAVVRAGPPSVLLYHDPQLLPKALRARFDEDMALAEQAGVWSA